MRSISATALAQLLQESEDNKPEITTNEDNNYIEEEDSKVFVES